MNEDAYFYGLRTVARKRTMDALNRRTQVDGGAADWNGTTLSSITEDAIEAAETEWKTHYSELTHAGFDKAWSSIWYHTSLQPSNFNLAIWQRIEGRDILQGLAAGTTSDGKNI